MPTPITNSSTTNPAPTTTPQPLGRRKNGKNWHPPRTAFRPTSGQTSYAKRAALTANLNATKAREKEMKAEKQEERTKRIQAITDRRKAREEKARFEKMAETMHRRRVERVRRREKRNRLLKS